MRKAFTPFGDYEKGDVVEDSEGNTATVLNVLNPSISSITGHARRGAVVISPHVPRPYTGYTPLVFELEYRPNEPRISK